MGRDKIIQHIENELSGRSDNSELKGGDDEAFCQYCGSTINVDGKEPDDFVVHSVPSHGGSSRNFVFYCGPTCFQEAIEELLQV